MKALPRSSSSFPTTQAKARVSPMMMPFAMSGESEYTQPYRKITAAVPASTLTGRS